MNTFEIHEIAGSFCCEWCGEITFGQLVELIDGFENIPQSIDQVCIHCLEQNK
jgi:hypothetical protein